MYPAWLDTTWRVEPRCKRALFPRGADGYEAAP